MYHKFREHGRQAGERVRFAYVYAPSGASLPARVAPG
jgi:hypothetical protein